MLLNPDSTIPRQENCASCNFWSGNAISFQIMFPVQFIFIIFHRKLDVYPRNSEDYHRSLRMSTNTVKFRCKNVTTARIHDEIHLHLPKHTHRAGRAFGHRLWLQPRLEAGHLLARGSDAVRLRDLSTRRDTMISNNLFQRLEGYVLRHNVSDIPSLCLVETQ